MFPLVSSSALRRGVRVAARTATTTASAVPRIYSPQQQRPQEVGLAASSRCPTTSFSSSRGFSSTTAASSSAASTTTPRDDTSVDEPREQMSFDVLIVGGGPAGLAASIRLKQLCAEHGKDLSVCLIDKGRCVHFVLGCCCCCCCCCMDY